MELCECECVCDIATNTQKNVTHSVNISDECSNNKKTIENKHLYTVYTRARVHITHTQIYICENSRFDTFKLEFLSLSIHRIAYKLFWCFFTFNIFFSPVIEFGNSSNRFTI